MTTTITAHFDGQFIVPDQPVDLPIGQSLRVSVETTETIVDRFAELRELAVDLPDIPNDLAAQHDHYLYGTPKK